MKCETCFRGCQLEEGQTGFCKARMCLNGSIQSRSYGKLTALSLDPIEKKPLACFHPGSLILSAGSYGCNLACPFCQNYTISQRDLDQKSHKLSPGQLVDIALSHKSAGNIGIAFTYNEPLISWEYVRDTFLLAKKAGLKTVLVTNGTASPKVLEQLVPLTDAWNIDLKAFSEEEYKKLQGDLDYVRTTIQTACQSSHVEITALIVPGRNDDPEQMEAMCAWIATLDRNIPLHITRYFPRWKEKEQATPLETLECMAAIARKHLNRVFIGNV